MVDAVRRFAIDAATAEAVIAHLRDALPNEGCGLLATRDHDGERVVLRFYPGDNIDQSPTRYQMDPRQVLAALDDLEARGWELGAIAHSHPRTEAAPSRTDLAEAYYRESLLLIVSFAEAEPTMRAWRLAPEGMEPPFTELPVSIASSSPAPAATGAGARR